MMNPKDIYKLMIKKNLVDQVPKISKTITLNSGVVEVKI
jgi:hypothetical protein